MSGPGVSYQDLLPLPETHHAVTDPNKREESHAMAEEPTASHALALAAVNDVDEEDKGAAQEEHDAEVKDLGWHEPPSEMPKPLVGGLPNEDLWMLIRRFNKQVQHVKEYPYPVPGNLDLNVAEEDEFSPDKLRATIERLYMTAVIGFMGFGNHIARLRSWRETRRTAWFCTVYSVAWLLDLLVPTFAVTIITLIVYPPARVLLFPPAPLALVSSSGGVRKPKAGVLGSHDSATGAPENHKGEAVEQEASNFVQGITSVVLSAATGKHSNSMEEENDSVADTVPDPTAVVSTAAAARDKVSGAKPQHDKTKVPMESTVWSTMRPAMHVLSDIVDGWERFANALSPTPPFPKDVARLRLAGLVVPMFVAGLFVTSYVFIKGSTLGFGFAVFGDPIISRGLKWLNQNYPGWQKLLELRNTILKGVPTNAQLTITLLRIGEANKAPLPPPPQSDEEPPRHPAELNENHLSSTGADASLGASEAEIHDAISHDPRVPHETGGPDIGASKAKHGKKGGKILAFFKAATRTAVEAALSADKLKAKAGSLHAKSRLGVVPRVKTDSVSGPVHFLARYNGKSGHVYISSKATIPCVSFSMDPTIETIGSQDREDLHPVWTVAAAEVKELKKVGGFGWKAKLVIGWALDREVVDGLEIVDKRGNRWNITACPLRDELFNRLIAMGGQKWESW